MKAPLEGKRLEKFMDKLAASMVNSLNYHAIHGTAEEAWEKEQQKNLKKAKKKKR